MRVLPTSLPCFPCPHRSVCCKDGASLTFEEASQLVLRYGHDHVQTDQDGSLSTALRGGTCVFMHDNACLIHEEACYPSNCRGYPWHDNTGAMQQWTDWVSYCPESEKDDENKPGDLVEDSTRSR